MSPSTHLRSGYYARENPMRGLRLHERCRVFGLVCSTDGRCPEVRRLRKRFDASGRHAARFVARDERRALPEVPTQAPSIGRVLLNREFREHGGCRVRSTIQTLAQVLLRRANAGKALLAQPM